MFAKDLCNIGCGELFLLAAGGSGFGMCGGVDIED